MNEKQKIDIEQAINDYTHCSRIKSCADCECAKTGAFTTNVNLCTFLREYTEYIRTKFADVINEIL